MCMVGDTLYMAVWQANILNQLRKSEFGDMVGGTTNLKKNFVRVSFYNLTNTYVAHIYRDKMNRILSSVQLDLNIERNQKQNFHHQYLSKFHHNQQVLYFQEMSHQY